MKREEESRGIKARRWRYVQRTVTRLWTRLFLGTVLSFSPRNDYPLKPSKKTVGGAINREHAISYRISYRCVNSHKKKKKRKRGAYLGQSLACFYCVLRFESEENFVESRDIQIRANQFRALRSPSTCTIQPLKSSGNRHPSFFLFVSQTPRLCNERWQKFHNLWLPYDHDIYFITWWTMNENAKNNNNNNNWILRILFKLVVKLKQIFIKWYDTI